MRKFLTSIVVFLLSTSLWAVQAYRGWQTKTLTDGSEITVRQIGDEFYHYWETEDGKIALEQKNGKFVKTNEARPSDEQFKARRAASSLNKPRKSIGKINLAPRGLLILVQFTDVTFDANNDQAAFNNMLNTPGYNYNGATGSAAEYFKAQSDSQYTPVFDVVGPVTLNHPCIYYGEEGYSSFSEQTESDLYMADFVIDAVLAADSIGCDFSQYDADNDGLVDFVYFIYAGKGQAAGGESWTIWPHNWTLASALYYGQTHGTSGYSYKPYVVPVLDGKRVQNYACSAELRKDGERSGIGTFCHEFGHVMGLPDYYVTTATAPNKGKKYTPGAWSIMDYGSYNNNEMTPPNYSAYDKLFLGWHTPKLLKKDAKRDITLTTDYKSSYQITGSDTAATATTEKCVWYLENRQKTGWDKYLPGHGMVIWEVTYNNDNWKNNEPNNDAVGYTIVTANDTIRPYKPYIYQTDENTTSGTPFPGTSNVTTFTPAPGCALTNIAENDGVITFKYNGGAPNYWTYEIDTAHCTVSSLSGQVDKDSALNLTFIADEGYTLDNEDCWAVEMDDELLEYGIGFTYNPGNGAFNIPAVTGDVYIIAEAQKIPVYTVRFFNAGEELSSATYYAGQTAEKPADPTPECEKYTFVGWWTAELAKDNTTEHAWVTDFTVTGAQDYYAIYNAETIYYTSVIDCSSAIDEVKNDVKVIKQIENGQIAILRGDNKYTLFGQKIK